jgi:hypothetical protein
MAKDYQGMKEESIIPPLFRLSPSILRINLYS